MAEVARRMGPPLQSERQPDYPFSSRVDEDLSNRVRSLIIARNGRHPPRAPCPSPDYSYAAYDSDENRSAYSSSISPQSKSLSVARTVAKLTLLDSYESAGIASRYDGPASQHEVSDGLLSTANAPNQGISISSMKSTRSRVPLYSLRTVPPHNSRSAKEPLESKLQHVPGSFVTESGASTPQGVQSPSYARSIAENTALEPNLEMHSRAVEALTNVKGHDALDGIQGSSSPIRRAPSISTLGSVTSTTRSYRPPSRLFIGQSNTSEAAEPVVTNEMGKAHRSSEGLGTSPSTLENSSGIAKGRYGGPSDTHDGRNTKFGDSMSHHSATEDPLGQSLAEALAQLPPIRGNASTEPAAPSPATSLASKIESPVSAHFRPSRQLTAVFLPTQDKSSFVTPSPSLDTPTVLTNSQKAVTSIEGISAPDVEASSTLGRRLSSFSSAVSGLSAISLQLPFSRSPTHHKSESSVQEAHLVPPFSYTKESQRSSDDSDLARLINNSQTMEATETKPKKHWIRTFLAPRPTIPLPQSPSYLTAKSSRRSSYAVKRQLLEKLPLEVRTLSIDDLQDRVHLDEKAVQAHERRNSISFSKVLQDLDTVLKEALLVAKHATDSRGRKGDPSTTFYRHKEVPRPIILKQDNYSTASLISSDGLSSFSGGLDEEEHYTSSPLQYSTHNDYPIQDFRASSAPGYEGEFVRNLDASAYPSRCVVPTRNQSTAAGITEVHLGGKKLEVQQGFRKASERSPAETDLILPSHDMADNISVSYQAQDWAVVNPKPQNLGPTMLGKAPSMPRQPDPLQPSPAAQQGFVTREHKPSLNAMYGASQKSPFIQPRTSSAGLRPTPTRNTQSGFSKLQSSDDSFKDNIHMSALQSTSRQDWTETQQTAGSRPTRPHRGSTMSSSMGHLPEDSISSPQNDKDPGNQEQSSIRKTYSLTNRGHFSIREGKGFSLSRSHRRAPIARDWNTSRKRYVASVACVSTALLGLIIGIYAGEVPAIQYAIVDEHHYTILGNVVFFLGLAITTAAFWPLPLLHGRKPYTLAALALLLPLQFPQALSVNTQRSPSVATYRVGLLLSRAIAGITMGFANVNFKATLLDLFGASLQSQNPHQEMVISNDVRRHGGGMGLWLGIWTWCSIGSIGLGFFIGAVLISGLDVSWGFWLTIILTAFVLVLNVLVPETRRSAYRRSMTEVRTGRDVSRRIARGEIKMHIDSTGPIWWWEELVAGYKLCLRLLKQPGFLILSVYVGWIYGQIVMLIVVSCQSNAS